MEIRFCCEKMLKLFRDEICWNLTFVVYGGRKLPALVLRGCELKCCPFCGAKIEISGRFSEAI
ncbi:MAG: hypothetical protein Q6363_009350 [Candidatus Njordarchaeota archaeon]